MFAALLIAMFCVVAGTYLLLSTWQKKVDPELYSVYYHCILKTKE